MKAILKLSALAVVLAATATFAHAGTAGRYGASNAGFANTTIMDSTTSSATPSMLLLLGAGLIGSAGALFRRMRS
jgi:hypothetical protein